MRPRKIVIDLKTTDNCKEVRDWIEKVNAATGALEALLVNPPHPVISIEIDGAPRAVQEPAGEENGE